MAKSKRREAKPIPKYHISSSLGEIHEVFPVSSSIFTAIEDKLKLEYDKRGLSIKPPHVNLDSAVGAAPFKFTIDTLEKAKKVKLESDNENSQYERINAFEQWSLNVTQFNTELELKQKKAVYICGLTKIPNREGGIEIKEEKELIEYYEMLGADVPEYGTLDYKYWYIENVVLPTPRDKFEFELIMVRVNESKGLVTSDVLEESVRAQVSTFQDFVGEQFGKLDFRRDINEKFEKEEAKRMAS